MSERLIISSPCIVGGYFGDNLGQLVLAGIGVSKMIYLRSARRFDPSDKTGQNSEKSPQCDIFWLSSPIIWRSECFDPFDIGSSAYAREALCFNKFTRYCVQHHHPWCDITMMVGTSFRPSILVAKRTAPISSHDRKLIIKRLPAQ